LTLAELVSLLQARQGVASIRVEPYCEGVGASKLNGIAMFEVVQQKAFEQSWLKRLTPNHRSNKRTTAIHEQTHCCFGAARLYNTDTHTRGRT
jgi:hypothetical protein